jgi:hypothetical protein
MSQDIRVVLECPDHSEIESVYSRQQLFSMSVERVERDLLKRASDKKTALQLKLILRGGNYSTHAVIERGIMGYLTKTACPLDPVIEYISGRNQPQVHLCLNERACFI